MSAPEDRLVRAGDPCPNGCTASERWEPFAPEVVRANGDGELSCPGCWDCFGIEADSERNGTPA